MILLRFQYKYTKLIKLFSPHKLNLCFNSLSFRVVDLDPDWILIQWGVWIRIWNPDLDQGSSIRRKVLYHLINITHPSTTARAGMPSLVSVSDRFLNIRIQNVSAFDWHY
jgi:hypothetical protein